MKELSDEYKMKVAEAMKDAFSRFQGTQIKFSKTLGINDAVLSQILNGKIKNSKDQNLLENGKWINIGRKLNVSKSNSKWVFVKTSVYLEIEDNVLFCKNNHKGMILVDDCGIGKTVAGKRLAETLENTFYIDCSQHKTTRQLVRAMARAVGVDDKGKIDDVMEDTKYYICELDTPVFIMDEVADLKPEGFLELKAYMNYTVGYCGWFFMGAQGLRARMKKGIDNEKVGFAEIFSRLSDKYITLIPTAKEKRQDFYMNLLSTVATAQIKDNPAVVRKLVLQCIDDKSTLRNLETLIDLYREQ